MLEIVTGFSNAFVNEYFIQPCKYYLTQQPLPGRPGGFEIEDYILWALCFSQKIPLSTMAKKMLES
jgi:hypothetical protein